MRLKSENYLIHLIVCVRITLLALRPSGHFLALIQDKRDKKKPRVHARKCKVAYVCSNDAFYENIVGAFFYVILFN